MSFNLTLVARDIAICVTDRRLTANGKVVSERSTKLTTFQCQDAHGFITYNGIGWDMQGQTPSDWLCDMPELASMPLLKMLDAIKADADSRLVGELAKKRPDTRHSFVIGGYHMLNPFLAIISNYEGLNGEQTLAVARPEMTIEIIGESRPARSAFPFALIATGASPWKKVKARDVIINKWKAGGNAEAVRAKMIKVVRDASYLKARKGTVGTSVLSAITWPLGGFEVGDHVPGGTTLMENPNHIGPGMMFKDAYVDVSGGKEFRSRYDPKTKTARINEPKCQSCGTPVPEGYRKCGGCDAPAPPLPTKVVRLA